MRCNITVCIGEILARGDLFGQVKYVVIQISKEGVTLRYAPVKFWPGGQVGRFKSVEI